MVFNKIVELRNLYFNGKLSLGYCSTVAVLIGWVLQQNGSVVKLVTGYCNGCGHMWLDVDGRQIDPSRDCAEQAGEFVYMVNDKEYVVVNVENLDINDYYINPTMDKLISGAKEITLKCKQNA